MLDIEADRPMPGDYAMICSSTVIREPSLATTVNGKLRLTAAQEQQQAVGISG